MARNKHPEETVEKILRVSLKLFQGKGYEATTIQDIVDALGMSKGAIYHHFKSKADIMDLLSERYYQNLSWFPDPKGIPGENGLEKLRYVFRYFLSDPSKEEIDGMMLPLLRDPKMVSLSLDSVFREAAPYMDRLVQELRLPPVSPSAAGGLHAADQSLDVDGAVPAGPGGIFAAASLLQGHAGAFWPAHPHQRAGGGVHGLLRPPPGPGHSNGTGPPLRRFFPAPIHTDRRYHNWKGAPL